jgi:hypothetical protein
MPTMLPRKMQPVTIYANTTYPYGFGPFFQVVSPDERYEAHPLDLSSRGWALRVSWLRDKPRHLAQLVAIRAAGNAGASELKNVSPGMLVPDQIHVP